jgi:hypothetical protein
MPVGFILAVSQVDKTKPVKLPAQGHILTGPLWRRPHLGGSGLRITLRRTLRNFLDTQAPLRLPNTRDGIIDLDFLCNHHLTAANLGIPPSNLDPISRLEIQPPETLTGPQVHNGRFTILQLQLRKCMIRPVTAIVAQVRLAE